MSSVFLYHSLFLETGSLTEPGAYHFSETGKSLGSACPLPLVPRLQMYATTPPFLHRRWLSKLEFLSFLGKHFIPRAVSLVP